MRGKDALFNQALAQGNPTGMVDFHNNNRCSTDGCLPGQDGAVPLEMALPLLAARVKKENQLSGVRINPANIGTFEIVAPVTCVSQIGRVVTSSVMLRNDMLDMKHSERSEVLSHAAVFAAVSRTIANEAANCAVHQDLELLSSKVRALDCRKATKSMAAT
jgi:hypothetical protein